MNKLGPTAIFAAIVGIIACLIAGNTWPKSTYLTPADPTLNVIGLAIGSTLIFLAALAALLELHASTVVEGFKTALAADREMETFEKQAAERQAARATQRRTGASETAE